MNRAAPDGADPFGQQTRAPEFELLGVDSDHAVAAAFNMLFAVWRLHTHYEPFRRSLHWMDLLARTHPEGIGVLHVVESTAIAPEPLTRRLFTEAMRHARLQHYAVVHMASGFKAASIRAVVAASFTLARMRAAHSVHAHVAEAARWSAAQQRRIGRSEGSEQIARVAEGLRLLHHERHPSTR